MKNNIKTNTYKAKAKVNLNLHITGRRGDGYHTLSSLIAFTDFGDDLIVSPANELNLIIKGPFAHLVDNNEDNLVLRAARLLAGQYKIQSGAAITLTKNIPVAAGLGGGSADAAATLQALNDFWALDLSINDLNKLAVELGADVPMCLSNLPVHAGGVGEILTSITLPRTPVLLVNPNLPCPTPAVFKSFDAPFRPEQSAPELKHINDLIACLETTDNQLTDAAVHCVPEIGDVLKTLSHFEGCRLVRMSGSGATCFGLFDGLETAQNACDNIRQFNPDWWATATYF